MCHWFTPLTTGLLLTACTKEVVVLKDAPSSSPQPGRWADVVHTARGELADPATSVDGVHMVYSEQQQPGESALYVQRLDRGRDAARVALAPALRRGPYADLRPKWHLGLFLQQPLGILGHPSHPCGRHGSH